MLIEKKYTFVNKLTYRPSRANWERNTGSGGWRWKWWCNWRGRGDPSPPNESTLARSGHVGSTNFARWSLQVSWICLFVSFTLISASNPPPRPTQPKVGYPSPPPSSAAMPNQLSNEPTPPPRERRPAPPQPPGPAVGLLADGIGAAPDVPNRRTRTTSTGTSDGSQVGAPKRPPPPNYQREF